jgi:hypothetical protein
VEHDCDKQRARTLPTDAIAEVICGQRMSPEHVSKVTEAVSRLPDRPVLLKAIRVEGSFDLRFEALPY